MQENPAAHSEFISRWQTSIITQLTSQRRVLLLAGSRQSGKTTLAKQLTSGTIEYRNLEDAPTKLLAETDMQQFVNHDKDMLIIDEVQELPALLKAIKLEVDEDRRPGRFLLTGSAEVARLPQTTESLAGRVALIRLRGLSQGEIMGTEPTFIGRCFNHELTAPAASFSRDEIINLALRGGFPEVLYKNNPDRRKWHQDYLRVILDHDLQHYTNIRRRETMQDLVAITAAWSAKYMNLAGIGNDLAIARNTLEEYLNVLETLFVIDRIPSWGKTDYRKAGKRKKLFMTDSGLMASLLNLRAEQVRLDADHVGKLLETFVYNELATQLDVWQDDYALYHYRDNENREIDLLIERYDGALLGIEVKAGSNISNQDFKHMRWFKENLAQDRPFTGVLLHTGAAAGSMGDGMWATPFGCLWS